MPSPLMLRVWPFLIIVLLLAACSSTPTRRESAPAISTPHAWKPPADLPAFVDHSVGEEEVSIQAMSLVGVPYRWGGNTPEAGFDCSGLVRYVVAHAARVDLPRTTGEMSLVGNAIQPDEVAPGDLIFFNTTGRPHSHVGIYVGGYRFVNAPSTGGTVRIDYISNPYWAKRFDGIRRVAATDRRGTPFDAPQLITSVNPEPAARSAQSPLIVQEPVDTAVRRDTRTATRAPIATGAGASANAAAEPTLSERGATPAAVERSDRSASAPSSADAFEPPPPSRTDAQSQAAAEHAVDVDPIASFARGTQTSGTRAEAPDSRTSTGDASAPAVMVAHPPAAAAAQARDDDPIARFANGE